MTDRDGTVARRVAKAMAPELGWDERREAAEASGVPRRGGGRGHRGRRVGSAASAAQPSRPAGVPTGTAAARPAAPARSAVRPHAPSRLAVLAVALATAAAPAAASAQASSATPFPGDQVDVAVSRVADLDVARDGTGAVVYVKPDGGVTTSSPAG